MKFKLYVKTSKDKMKVIECKDYNHLEIMVRDFDRNLKGNIKKVDYEMFIPLQKISYFGYKLYGNSRYRARITYQTID